MKTCPDCGCRVYRLGCVNCCEEAYIEQQAYFDSLHYPEKKPCPVCEGRGWVEYAKLTGLTECCPGCGGTGERKP